MIPTPKDVYGKRLHIRYQQYKNAVSEYMLSETFLQTCEVEVDMLREDKHLLELLLTDLRVAGWDIVNDIEMGGCTPWTGSSDPYIHYSIQLKPDVLFLNQVRKND